MKKKILGIIVILVILVGAIYIVSRVINKTSPQEISIVGWKTFIDDKQNITFQYPEKLPTTYMNAVDWPLKITISKEPFSCVQATPANNLPGETKEVAINNHVYCVSFSGEGAAGSIYVTYNYVIEKSGQLITANFVVQYPQCVNYDEPRQTQCKNEQSTFDLAGTIDRIIQTIKNK